MTTFIVDCPVCKAKVAAEEKGRAERFYTDEDIDEHFGFRLCVGNCPRCGSLIAGHLTQTAFEGYDSIEDEWSDVERIFPQPSRVFRSGTIPKSLLLSLSEGEKSLLAGAT